MKNLNLFLADKVSFCDIQKAVVAQVTQLRSRHSFIDTSPTQQVVMPFDLGDVARAFNGSFASRFAHLEDQSDD